jgi:hypothetical protein
MFVSFYRHHVMKKGWKIIAKGLKKLNFSNFMGFMDVKLVEIRKLLA